MTYEEVEAIRETQRELVRRRQNLLSFVREANTVLYEAAPMPRKPQSYHEGYAIWRVWVGCVEDEHDWTYTLYVVTEGEDYCPTVHEHLDGTEFEGQGQTLVCTVAHPEDYKISECSLDVNGILFMLDKTWQRLREKTPAP